MTLTGDRGVFDDMHYGLNDLEEITREIQRLIATETTKNTHKFIDVNIRRAEIQLSQIKNLYEEYKLEQERSE